MMLFHNFVVNLQIMINPALIEMLNRKAGYDVSNSSGAERLRLDIYNATGERIGLNTLKRLLGILDYEGSHRGMIMDIVARYLNYPSWNVLEATLNDRISSFNNSKNILISEELAVNQKLEIQWDPDRKIIIEHTSGKNFKVLESRNSKLQTGDLLVISQIATGYPLYISEVIRDDSTLGNYTAAINNGIRSVRLL